jgi:hypothetical protein
VINWRIDGAVMRFRMTPEMSEERILAILPGPVVALHKGTLRHLGIASGPMRLVRIESYIGLWI